MGLIGHLEKRSSEFLSNLRTPQPWLFEALGSSRTSSGVSVGPRNALENTPALRAVRLICEALSSVPLNLMEQTGERQKRILRDDPVHWLVHAEPNEMMTSAVWRAVLQLHALTWGNGYAFIEREALTLRPRALLPLAPEHTQTLVDKRGLFYRTRGDDGSEIDIQPRDVLHLPWLSWDGITGESPVRLGRRSIGLGIAAEESTAKFFGQGMQHSAVIEQAAGSALNDKEVENLRKAVQEKFGGLSNFWRPLILKPGLSWKQAGMDLDKAQARELREMQVADAARIYGVPLHLLAAGDKTSTYASVEQFELIYVKHTLLPWFFLWEQELERKLLPRERRQGENRLFFKFNLEGLLRGDKLSRATANQTELQNGALTVNEWRNLEDRDPSPLPQADTPLIMASQLDTLDAVGKEPAAAGGGSGEGLAGRLLRQEARRCADKTCLAIAAIGRKFPGDAQKYVSEVQAAVRRIAGEYPVFKAEGFERVIAMAEAAGPGEAGTLSAACRDFLAEYLSGGVQ